MTNEHVHRTASGFQFSLQDSNVEIYFRKDESTSVLDIEDARALRDWLNKAIPSEPGVLPQLGDVISFGGQNFVLAQPLEDEIRAATSRKVPSTEDAGRPPPFNLASRDARSEPRASVDIENEQCARDYDVALCSISMNLHEPQSAKIAELVLNKWAQKPAPRTGE